MVEKIKINIPNYIVDIDKDKCIINDKEIYINKEDIDGIIRIIRNWKNEYRGFIPSGNEYNIVINSDGKEYIYKFINAFPDDFFILNTFLGGLYDRK